MSTRFGRAMYRHSGEADRTVFLSLAWVAAFAVLARMLAAVFINVPATPSRAPVSIFATVGSVLGAVALVTAGLRAVRTPAGIGLVFAGVFGGLGVASEAALIPATVALTAGTGLFWLTRDDQDSLARTVVAGALLTTVGLGLGSSVTGTTTLRPHVSTLAFLALAATPVFVTTHRRSLFRAGLAFTVVLAFGLGLPFVTGAVALVGAGALGTSLPVIALAVAGAVTTASAALRERQWEILLGITLLLTAGVPATVPRAVPFTLGIVALVSQEGRK